jgi:hypothetical protein
MRIIKGSYNNVFKAASLTLRRARTKRRTAATTPPSIFSCRAASSPPILCLTVSVQCRRGFRPFPGALKLIKCGYSEPVQEPFVRSPTNESAKCCTVHEWRQCENCTAALETAANVRNGPRPPPFVEPRRFSTDMSQTALFIRCSSVTPPDLPRTLPPRFHGQITNAESHPKVAVMSL